MGRYHTALLQRLIAKQRLAASKRDGSGHCEHFGPAAVILPDIDDQGVILLVDVQVALDASFEPSRKVSYG